MNSGIYGGGLGQGEDVGSTKGNPTKWCWRGIIGCSTYSYRLVVGV